MTNTDLPRYLVTAYKALVLCINKLYISAWWKAVCGGLRQSATRASHSGHQEFLKWMNASQVLQIKAFIVTTG